MLSLKIVAVGDRNVGKRCLLRSYVEGQFPNDDVKNVSNGYKKDIEFLGKSIRLVLWDINVDEENARLRHLTYPLTDLFLLCFSLVDQNSMDNIEKIWHREITRHCPHTPFILVGTKSDLLDSSMLSNHGRCSGCVRTKAEELCKRIHAFKYVECSSLIRDGLDNVFNVGLHSICSAQTPNGDVDGEEQKEVKNCVLM
ncbi:cell division control protein 42 homolog isoform X1 [Mytilus trossulus]|uniref:cell division control protein 42 homolog isoform X1 n=1 Tax=Mytilus trossulus TaxID=6551 RepID=UPI0030067D56